MNVLQKVGGHVKKWYICPYCKKKLIKYEKNAESKGIFLLCKNCRKEIEIKITIRKNQSLN